MKRHRGTLDLPHAHGYTDRRDEANRRIYETRQRRCWEVYPDRPLINRLKPDTCWIRAGLPVWSRHEAHLLSCHSPPYLEIWAMKFISREAWLSLNSLLSTGSSCLKSILRTSEIGYGCRQIIPINPRFASLVNVDNVNWCLLRASCLVMRGSVLSAFKIR